MKFGRLLAVSSVLWALAANGIAGVRGGHGGAGGHMAGAAHFHGGHRFDGRHHHHGYGRATLFIGVPLLWSGYETARPYNPPPQAYVSQDDADSTWYYCDNPQGYYPQVPECPGGWQTVENGSPPQLPAGDTAIGTPPELGRPAAAPPVSPATPLQPAPPLASPAPITSCDPNGCRDSNGVRYNGWGPGTIRSDGKLCQQVGSTMQCY